MNLPPLPALPVLPAMPALPPLTALDTTGQTRSDALTLPLPFEPAPVPLKRTEWFPLTVSPFHAGKYELGIGLADHVIVTPDFWLWDGREWADKLPDSVSLWRGWDRSRWVNVREENPPLPGWYPMRFPRADKKAPSFWDGVRWMYAHPQTGEMLPYAAGAKWQAEWFHDGAP